MRTRIGGNLREILKQRIPWLTPVGLAPSEPSDSPGFHDCKDGTARDAFVDNWINLEASKWYSAIKEIDGQYIFCKMRNPAANRWANARLQRPSDTLARFTPVRITDQEIAENSGHEKLPALPHKTRAMLDY